MKFLLTIAALLILTCQLAEAAEVNVYSARKEHLIKPFFDKFTKKTGIKVNYITDKAPKLLTKIKSEGKRTNADLLITVDAANLHQAAKEGILQKVDSKKLNKAIPAQYRDPGSEWFGLTLRARTIVYSSLRIKDPKKEFSTYEALGDKKWQGRLCLRTSKKVYNQSLVAMMIAEKGETQTEKVVAAWVKNLASPVKHNDTAVLEAIIAGECDVGIVNTYYFGRLLKKDKDTPLALFWPNQSGSSTGVHVNISGAGITKEAKNQKGALQLLEFLASEKVQEDFAGENMEYPVNPVVKPVKTVAAWGDFKKSPLNLNKAGQLQPTAIRLMDKAGYK